MIRVSILYTSDAYYYWVFDPNTRRAAPRVASSPRGRRRDITLKLRWAHARALHDDPGATHDDLREAVTILEDAERTARRVLGGAHPVVVGIVRHLGDARDALYSRGLP